MPVGYKTFARDNQNKLRLNFIVLLIQQVIYERSYVKYMKRKWRHIYNEDIKQKRFWALQILDLNFVGCRAYVFTEERKFNLDGLDGLNYH